MLNSHFVGRIGKDGAQIIKSKNGSKFLSMDVATDYYSKGENKTMWIRVRTNIERYIEKLSPYLKKGTLITVEGQQLPSNNWIGKDGEAHSQIVIIANFIDFVRTGKKTTENNDAESDNAKNSPAQPSAPADSDDDLPF